MSKSQTRNQELRNFCGALTYVKQVQHIRGLRRHPSQPCDLAKKMQYDQGVVILGGWASLDAESADIACQLMEILSFVEVSLVVIVCLAFLEPWDVDLDVVGSMLDGRMSWRKA